MRVYIAGPMTGLPEWNYPAFHHAAAAWRNAGWEVLNPAESFDGDTTKPYPLYVEADVALLKTCDAIAMLPGWDEGNSGAVWEHEIAKSLLGLWIYDATQPVTLPQHMTPDFGRWIDACVPLKRGGEHSALGRWPNGHGT